MTHAAEVSRAAAYAVQVADGYLASLGAAGLSPRGLVVLELGPGPDLGAALILAGLGASVTVADRFLHAWDRTRHPSLYAALREALCRHDPPLPTLAVDAALARGRYDEALRACRAGIERLGAAHGLRPATFDVCFSNAVLEHVHDLPAACRRLAALTKPGGHGFHQVDFRDHRDFERPLEHLTSHPMAHLWRHLRHRGALGSRWRRSHLLATLRRAGFEVLDFETNLRADERYLDSLQPRCRAEFRDLPREELAVLSGRVHVRRLQQGEAQAAG